MSEARVACFISPLKPGAPGAGGHSQRVKSVKYKQTYEASDKRVTVHQRLRLPQVEKAYPSKQPLRFTLGMGRKPVSKVERQPLSGHSPGYPNAQPN